MTSMLIDVPDVLTTLHMLVERHGADTVRTSDYTKVVDGVVILWCFAGCAFAEWGVSMGALQAVEGTSVAEVALDWPLDDVVELTEHALAVLETAQEMQDSGAPWGEAETRARETAVNWPWDEADEGELE